MDLFDEVDLYECTHEDFPGGRLVVCRNPALAAQRAAKRRELLEATCTQLEQVRQMVANARLEDCDKIGVRVGRVINK
ncbi:hypothetical protein G3480_10440 [Thiorhodococcus mannitoliphagus]|uniref:Uncharacterized protein n=1 Tax=Thiorhodococcus mannitoliphagus TaxID=329406 RepID=A0A6P1DU63_9GAMM|nr:hypothetical protein [Thiorhodococcus mannitoliphagus]NEX20723.1 hypothetical protein [Thiorhodococcus mannitoliphagus]